MTSPLPIPPAIPGLRWKPAADGMWAAPLDRKFLHIECSVERPACVHSLDGVLYIHMTAAESDAAEIEAWRAGIEASAAAEAASLAVVRKRYHDYAGPRHAAAVRAEIAEGWALYNEFGPAIRKVTPLLRLLNLVYLEPLELTRLRKLLREIRGIIDGMEADALALAETSDVYLDDEFVEKAIRLLTALDADMRTEANRRGWGGNTGAPGHWCCALLKTDRARAIRIGRGLVARHLVQLKKLGLEPMSAADARALEGVEL